MWGLTAQQTQELDGLEIDGMLSGQDLVNFARDPDTAFHHKFEWAEDRAAELCRLEQARRVIRAYVVKHELSASTVRAYVRLITERGDAQYMRVENVMSDEQGRAQLLEDAKNEMAAFRRKYYALKELAKVFEEMESLIDSRTETRRGKIRQARRGQPGPACPGPARQSHGRHGNTGGKGRTMITFYKFDPTTHAVSPCDDPWEWARWFEKTDRTVARTWQANHGGVRVLTVFLGVNHNWADGPPLVFETMVLGGPLDGHVERYSTWEDAQAGHDRLVSPTRVVTLGEG